MRVVILRHVSLGAERPRHPTEAHPRERLHRKQRDDERSEPQRLVVKVDEDRTHINRQTYCTQTRGVKPGAMPGDSDHDEGGHHARQQDVAQQVKVPSMNLWTFL